LQLELRLLHPGDVLVTRQTDPGWGPLFFLIKGLVMERGGMLSHGAILAREYGDELRRRGVFIRYFDQDGVRDCIRISVARRRESELLLEALRASEARFRAVRFMRPRFPIRRLFGSSSPEPECPFCDENIDSPTLSDVRPLRASASWQRQLSNTVLWSRN